VNVFAVKDGVMGKRFFSIQSQLRKNISPEKKIPEESGLRWRTGKVGKVRDILFGVYPEFIRDLFGMASESSEAVPNKSRINT
jgi:hypothetical protein